MEKKGLVKKLGMGLATTAVAGMTYLGGYGVANAGEKGLPDYLVKYARENNLSLNKLPSLELGQDRFNRLNYVRANCDEGHRQAKKLVDNGAVEEIGWVCLDDKLLVDITKAVSINGAEIDVRTDFLRELFKSKDLIHTVKYAHIHPRGAHPIPSNKDFSAMYFLSHYVNKENSRNFSFSIVSEEGLFESRYTDKIVDLPVLNEVKKDYAISRHLCILQDNLISKTMGDDKNKSTGECIVNSSTGRPYFKFSYTPWKDNPKNLLSETAKNK